MLELSIVLVVVGLIVSIGMTMGPDMIFTGKVAQTRDQMERIRQAIEGYAMTNNRLPCPDISSDSVNDGVEDLGNITANVCDANATGLTAPYDTGYLPYTTLGLPTNKDAWGNRIRYAVYIRSSATGTGGRTPDLATDHNSDDGTELSRTDFCTKLVTAATSTLATGTDIHVANLTGNRAGNNSNSDCTTGMKVPFALATSGARDANNDGNKFDGSNNPGNSYCFDNPDRILKQYSEEQTSTDLANGYDDIVAVESFPVLISRMNCKNN
ncbi:MAG: hypothetical protein H7833_10275 [Magnetococcus sp. DMHC-1]|nr:hypothetical protein [Magnetococcales bacterium]